MVVNATTLTSSLNRPGKRAERMKSRLTIAGHWIVVTGGIVLLVAATAGPAISRAAERTNLALGSNWLP